jgi:hypothetical protein
VPFREIPFQIVCDSNANSKCLQHYCECDRDVVHGIEAAISDNGGNCPAFQFCPAIFG